MDAYNGTSNDDRRQGEEALGREVAAKVRRLREALGTMRVTLRLDVEGMNFPVIGEAVIEGAPSIADDNTVDQRSAATAQWVIKNRKVLVQPNFRSNDTRPPAALIGAYGVEAQMLAPILNGDRVVGWISAHSSTERNWGPSETRLITNLAWEFSARLKDISQAVRSARSWVVLHGPGPA